MDELTKCADVSVVIPTYNRKELLKQAIASCFAGNETMDVEVIVVDDGSTDGTREWLKNQTEYLQVEPILQEHQGPQIARNKGKEAAKGTYVKFLDDDDYLCKGALSEEIRRIEQTKSDVSFGNLCVKSSTDDFTIENKINEDMACSLFIGTLKPMPHTFTYRQSILSDLQWDTSVPYYQDADFAMSVASKLPKVVQMNRTVATYRRHSQASITSERLNDEIEKTLDWEARIIWRGIEQLKNRRNMKNIHRESASTGIWQWIHMMAPFNFRRFIFWYRKVRSLNPDFKPNRKYDVERLLDNIFSPLVTELIFLLPRKIRAKCQT